MKQRTITISFEDAVKWYKSNDKVKKKLALLAYKEDELRTPTYEQIIHSFKDFAINTNLWNLATKACIYNKLLDIAYYYNQNNYTEPRKYYILPIEAGIRAEEIYKDYSIIEMDKKERRHTIYPLFRSILHAKKAIDILGDELKFLFK